MSISITEDQWENAARFLNDNAFVYQPHRAVCAISFFREIKWGAQNGKTIGDSLFLRLSHIWPWVCCCREEYPAALEALKEANVEIITSLENGESLFSSPGEYRKKYGNYTLATTSCPVITLLFAKIQLGITQGYEEQAQEAEMHQSRSLALNALLEFEKIPEDEKTFLRNTGFLEPSAPLLSQCRGERSETSSLISLLTRSKLFSDSEAEADRILESVDAASPSITMDHVLPQVWPLFKPVISAALSKSSLSNHDTSSFQDELNNVVYSLEQIYRADFTLTDPKEQQTIPLNKTTKNGIVKALKKKEINEPEDELINLFFLLYRCAQMVEKRWGANVSDKTQCGKAIHRSVTAISLSPEAFTSLYLEDPVLVAMHLSGVEPVLESLIPKFADEVRRSPLLKNEHLPTIKKNDAIFDQMIGYILTSCSTKHKPAINLNIIRKRIPSLCHRIESDENVFGHELSEANLIDLGYAIIFWCASGKIDIAFRALKLIQETQRKTYCDLASKGFCHYPSDLWMFIGNGFLKGNNESSSLECFNLAMNARLKEPVEKHGFYPPKTKCITISDSVKNCTGTPHPLFEEEMSIIEKAYPAVYDEITSGTKVVLAIDTSSEKYLIGVTLLFRIYEFSLQQFIETKFEEIGNREAWGSEDPCRKDTLYHELKVYYHTLRMCDPGVLLYLHQLGLIGTILHPSDLLLTIVDKLNPKTDLDKIIAQLEAAKHTRHTVSDIFVRPFEGNIYDKTLEIAGKAKRWAKFKQGILLIQKMFHVCRDRKQQIIFLREIINLYELLGNTRAKEKILRTIETIEKGKGKGKKHKMSDRELSFEFSDLPRDSQQTSSSPNILRQPGSISSTKSTPHLREIAYVNQTSSADLSRFLADVEETEFDDSGRTPSPAPTIPDSTSLRFFTGQHGDMPFKKTNHNLQRTDQVTLNLQSLATPPNTGSSRSEHNGKNSRLRQTVSFKD